MKLFVIAALVAAVAAQPAGVMVPPNNWQYTVGDRSCTKAHCSVSYPPSRDSCTCGGYQVVHRQIGSCMPHCGSTCHMCKVRFPATKHVVCPRAWCAPGEWEALNLDCKVSDWDPEWSECSKPCRDKFGPGIQFKRKRIIRGAMGQGQECPPEASLYQERTCNDVQCTEPTACHENPYCAGAMEECKNVMCTVHQHAQDGGNGMTHKATGCTDDGFGVVTCDQDDVTFVPGNPEDPECQDALHRGDAGVSSGKHKNGCSGEWYLAAGKAHIRVSHKSWSPADGSTDNPTKAWFNPALPHQLFEAHNGESEGAQHFCKIHYPFGLKKPYCKCMCATKASVVQQCNHDRTVCHLVASETLKAEIAKQTGFTASNTPAFAQAAGLSADPQPYVVKHAQGTASIKAHQESQYTAGDLALAKAARAAP